MGYRFGYKHLTKELRSDGTMQRAYRFRNGYGASVLEGGPFAYGGLELAVTKFYGPGESDWLLTYETPITSDVLGHLTPESVKDHLEEIKALSRSEWKD